MSSEAESSSQALERFLSSQLASLSLTVPQDDVEFMSRFIEEEGLEREEKVEGARAMLEGVIEEGELPLEGVDDVLGKAIDEWTRLKKEEEDRLAEEDASSSEEDERTSKPADILASLTPEELAAAQRQALLRQYAYVEGSAEEEEERRLGAGAPPRGDSVKRTEEEKAAEERRRLVEAAIRLDSKKKKHKKAKQVDLLAPNLNKDKAIYLTQIQRDAQKKASAERRDRDKAALEKQKADQVKAKADKQKKTAKQERRA
ncbi:hypothetical protein BCR39DRAFT_565179 [Naematelia encephala]|uniref:Coiled-coil domain-containing protein 43 n=1 Tax=Naematelia encephala TaxID=71784 RepID=A0A1Y2B3G3_9TREE|nr:hypothetical protein BCR39DRAFT_565179 [Naematelia encephala]